MFAKLVIRILSICVLIFIQACATAPKGINYSTVPENEEAIMEEGKGYVVVRVANATHLKLFHYNQLTLTPKNVNIKKKINHERIFSLPETDISSRTYLAALPPGEYSISDLRYYFSNGSYIAYSTIPNSPVFGTFHINKNEVTNLGNIVIYTTRNNGEYYSRWARSSMPLSVDAIFNEKFPLIAKSLANLDSPSTWNADGLDEIRENSYRYISQHPSFIGEAKLTPSNKLYFLSRLGTMLVRNKDGDWTIDAVDSDGEITFFDESISGVQVLANEFNDLFVRNSLNENWKKYELPVVNSEIHYLSFDNFDNLYAIFSVENTAFLYRKIANTETWEKMGNIRSEQGWDSDLFPETNSDKYKFGVKKRLLKKKIKAMAVINVGHKLLIKLGESFTAFDFSSLNFSPIEIDIEPVDFFRSNGQLFARETSFWSGLPSTIHRSDDDGITWKNITGVYTSSRVNRLGKHIIEEIEPRTTEFPSFWTKQKGFIISNGALLLKTVNGGDYWEKIEGQSLLPSNCNRLIPELNEQTLLLSCENSSEFYRSDDEGKTWVQDRYIEE